MDLEMGHRTIRDQYLDSSTFGCSGVQWTLPSRDHPVTIQQHREMETMLLENLSLRLAQDATTGQEYISIPLPWDTILKGLASTTEPFMQTFSPYLLLNSIRVTMLDFSAWPSTCAFDLQLYAKDRANRDLRVSNHSMMWARGHEAARRLHGIPVYGSCKAGEKMSFSPYLMEQEFRTCLLDLFRQWSHWPWEHIVTFTRPSIRNAAYVTVLLHDPDKDRHRAASPLAMWLLKFMMHLWLPQGLKISHDLSLLDCPVRWVKSQPYEIEIKKEFLEAQWNACQAYLECLSPFLHLTQGMELRLIPLVSAPVVGTLAATPPSPGSGDILSILGLSNIQDLHADRFPFRIQMEWAYHNLQLRYE